MRQPNGKFRYNCSIIDLYDRSAVASLNSDCINTDLAINTLKTALKKEKHPKVICNFYNVTSFSNVEMMDELTTKYINWYNYVRPHSHNNYLTPMEARYRQVFIEQSVAKRLDQYRFSVSGRNGTLFHFAGSCILIECYSFFVVIIFRLRKEAFLCRTTTLLLVLFRCV